MNYKKKYLKYKAKYLSAKNILKTGGSSSPERSMKQKRAEKDAVIKHLEKIKIQKIDDCNKLQETTQRNNCLKEANDNFESSIREKGKKERINNNQNQSSVNNNQNQLSENIENEQDRIDKENIRNEINSNESMSPAAKEFLRQRYDL